MMLHPVVNITIYIKRFHRYDKRLPQKSIEQRFQSKSKCIIITQKFEKYNYINFSFLTY